MRQGRQATNIFNKRGWDTTRRDYSRFGGHLALTQSWPCPWPRIDPDDDGDGKDRGSDGDDDATSAEPESSPPFDPTNYGDDG